MKLRLIIILMAAMPVTSCAPMTGVPSFSLMTRETANDGRSYQPVTGKITEQECWQLFLPAFIATGNMQPTHESIAARTLEKYDADVILNAQLFTERLGIPFFYLRVCTGVEGTPARLVEGDRE